MNYRFINRIADIPADKWNGIAGTDYPFSRYEFLHALEISGSVDASRGWQSQHLLIEDNKQLVAIVPLYIKSHSYGEYVFDHTWAQAYQQHGMDYYPKLLSAIPFTPATGQRLMHIECDKQLLTQTVNTALREKMEEIKGSGWHCLFPAPNEVALWESCEADVRLGCQYHWFNRGYKNFDDFLAYLTSRKRKTIKRERARVAEQGIRVARFTGEHITKEHWQCVYHFYQLTNIKYNRHGGYLTEAFFTEIVKTLREQMLLVLAFDKEEIIACTLSFFSGDTLYGRLWGASKAVDCLHFEASYYQGIEFCLERGLKQFDGGAQGEHKIARGFEPVITHSLHWVKHPAFRHAIKEFLVEESKAIRHYQLQAAMGLPFKENKLDEPKQT